MSVEQAMRLLCDDLVAMGTDKPSRLYFVTGDPDDPTFELATEVGDPRNDLERFYSGGLRLPKEMHGLLLASEAWRAKTFEEAKGSYFVAKLVEFAQEAAGCAESAANDVVKRAYHEALMGLQPSAMPDDLRVDTRVMVYVARGDVVHHLMRDELCDKYYAATYDQARGVVSDLLMSLVNGRRIERDCVQDGTIMAAGDE